MLDGVVDRDAALGYLSALKKRRPETSYRSRCLRLDNQCPS